MCACAVHIFGHLCPAICYFVLAILSFWICTNWPVTSACGGVTVTLLTFEQQSLKAVLVLVHVAWSTVLRTQEPVSLSLDVHKQSSSVPHNLIVTCGVVADNHIQGKMAGLLPRSHFKWT